MFKKYSYKILAVVFLGFLFSTQLLAQENKDNKTAEKSECKKTDCSTEITCCKDKSEMKDAHSKVCTDKLEAKKATSSKISNKLCPVMGEDVDSVFETIEYHGKTIGFCCEKCVAKFKKNPEKYMKKFKDQDSKADKS